MFIDVPKVAQYLVRDGLEIVVQAAEAADPFAVRAHLLGEAVPVLLHQRGLFPLHASAAVTPHGVIAFTGDSGYGKSTMASMLAERGSPTLTDDELLVTQDESGDLVAWPSFPLVNLKQDSVRALGLDEEARWSNYRKYGKMPFLRPKSFADMPHRFRKLYCLEWLETGEERVEVEKLEGFEALMRLRPCVIYRDLVKHYAGEQAYLTWAAGFLQRAELLILRRPKRFSAIPKVLDAIMTSVPH
jgi:hypothetical protein